MMIEAFYSGFIDSNTMTIAELYSAAVDACIPADDYARMRGDIDDVPQIMEQLKQYGNSVIPIIPEIIGRSIINHLMNSK